MSRGEDAAVPTRLGQAVLLHRAGDREEARNRLLALWEEAGRAGDAFHRSAIAHYLADTQDDPAVALVWDLRALAAADGAAARDGDQGPAAALYPALYTRLAADHARLGDGRAARRALQRARGAAAGLADGPYAGEIRAAIERLSRRLAGGG
ncbi:hypothetical protein GCM10009716_41090 [Streptomyces sodiiphilus]|uniref:Tetratricopeptide repeat protein n=1 Tax=Streptomyces sodiiphilus TaxID=226217 RepID=A0ABN2PS49_9ACTN